MLATLLNVVLEMFAKVADWLNVLNPPNVVVLKLDGPVTFNVDAMIPACVAWMVTVAGSML